MKKIKRKVKRSAKRAVRQSIISYLISLIPPMPGRKVISRFIKSMLSTFSLNLLAACVLTAIVYYVLF